MKRIRLLPLVLIAVSALLAVKVLGFVMGVEPFAVGPQPAVASGAEGHGEAAAPAEPAGPDTSAVDRMTAPINLADEYKKLKAEQDKAAAGHGGGHGEAAPAEGKPAAEGGHAAAPAEGGGHAAAPAADASHGAAPADAKPDGDKATDAKAAGEAAPAADAAHAASSETEPTGEAHPTTDAGHGAPADAKSTEAKPAEAGEHGVAPAAEGGHGAPAEGGHGAKAKTDVYTERPKEYSPPIGSSERAILEGLAVRRDELDKRAQDLDLRAKLLEAAEKRLNDRVNQLQSIETQLGVAGGGAPATAPSANAPTAAAPAAASKAASASPPLAPGAPAGATPSATGAPPVNDQLAPLVALYEGMKPKAAAAVFDKLDTGTLLELAQHMNPRKLSPIIAAMDPEKASRITGLMVGAQQAQKHVVVQVEQLAPSLGAPAEVGAAAPADASQLPQIMPAAAGH